ncbi:MAG: hypothetical protein LBS30_01265 [Planctomycetota bacterium]|nr:hypothetical protein [Planctomycetota bacterium]
MFRKPMRLEQWIAFDGAVGADALALIQDTPPDAADAQDNAPDVNAFAFVEPENEAAATEIRAFAGAAIPGAGADTLDINMTDDSITYSPHPDGSFQFVFRGGDAGITIAGDLNTANDRNFAVTLSDPENGVFGFFSMSEAYGTDDGAAFVARYGLESGDQIALLDGMQIRFRSVTPDGELTQNQSSSFLAEYIRNQDNSITFYLTANNDKMNNAFAILLHSLRFEPDSGLFPPPATIGAFTVTASYNSMQIGDPVHVVHADPGGNENGHPPPGPGEQEPPPILPPPPPIDPGSSGGGETGGGESGIDAGGEADSGTDAGGDSDSGGEGGDTAAGGDDLNYIFRQENASGDEDASDDAETGQSGDGMSKTEAEIVVALEDRTMESAAAVTAVELAREVEFLLTSARSERDVLLGSLSRLQEEYLRKSGRVMDEDFRALLRRLFESGNREKEAMNRIIAEMNKQLNTYRAFDPAFRDGMLTESLRELVDSAERRTGETGALSQAIEAVVLMLSREGPLPDAKEAQAAFDKTYADALQKWHEKAELSDPMGKELAAAARESKDFN